MELQRPPSAAPGALPRLAHLVALARGVLHAEHLQDRLVEGALVVLEAVDPVGLLEQQVQEKPTASVKKAKFVISDEIMNDAMKIDKNLKLFRKCCY